MIYISSDSVLAVRPGQYQMPYSYQIWPGYILLSVQKLNIIWINLLSDCDPRPACVDFGGICRKQCLDHEAQTRIRNGCKGRKCKCCKARKYLWRLWINWLGKINNFSNLRCLGYVFHNLSKVNLSKANLINIYIKKFPKYNLNLKNFEEYMDNLGYHWLTPIGLLLWR